MGELDFPPEKKFTNWTHTESKMTVWMHAAFAWITFHTFHKSWYEILCRFGLRQVREEWRHTHTGELTKQTYAQRALNSLFNKVVFIYSTATQIYTNNNDTSPKIWTICVICCKHNPCLFIHASNRLKQRVGERAKEKEEKIERGRHRWGDRDREQEHRLHLKRCFLMCF